eukprot:scaffold198780_cov25-Tisochrysis_lutea.AAC.1
MCALCSQHPPKVHAALRMSHTSSCFGGGRCARPPNATPAGTGVVNVHPHPKGLKSYIPGSSSSSEYSFTVAAPDTLVLRRVSNRHAESCSSGSEDSGRGTAVSEPSG